jgi:hypothetical protein
MARPPLLFQEGNTLAFSLPNHVLRIDVLVAIAATPSNRFIRFPCFQKSDLMMA